MGASYIYTYVDTGSSFFSFIDSLKDFVNNASDEVLARLMHIMYDEEYDDKLKIEDINSLEGVSCTHEFVKEIWSPDFL